MRTFLIGFFAFLTALLVTMAVLFALLSYTLHRRNRVVADVETAAPLSWLGAPTQAARLHRRLRTAVGTVYVPTKRGHHDADRHATLCRTLVAEATEIDRHLVLSSRLPSSRRRQAMRLLEGQVSEVERLALRLNRLRRSLVPGLVLDGSVPTTSDVLADLGRELDLLDEAHAELRAIEQANGLLDPTELLRQADERTAPTGPAAARAVPHADPAPPRPAPRAAPQAGPEAGPQTAQAAAPQPALPPPSGEPARHVHTPPPTAVPSPPPPTGRPITHFPPPPDHHR